MTVIFQQNTQKVSRHYCERWRRMRERWVEKNVHSFPSIVLVYLPLLYMYILYLIGYFTIHPKMYAAMKKCVVQKDVPLFRLLLMLSWTRRTDANIYSLFPEQFNVPFFKNERKNANALAHTPEHTKRKNNILFENIRTYNVDCQFTFILFWIPMANPIPGMNDASAIKKRF